MKFLQWTKRLGLKFHLSQRHPSSWFYGYNSINSIQKFDKWHNFSYLSFNCWCLLKNSKTLWYRENHNRGSYGQAGYVSIQIWDGTSLRIILIALVDVEVCLGIPSCGTRWVTHGSRGLILGSTGRGRPLLYPASVFPKEKSKKNKLPARNKIALELLHHILGHRSTISLLAGDTANVWEYVELRIDPDPFGISWQIYSMNKRARSKIPLKPKAPFKWVFMDIVPSTAPWI